jgi:hypothetical protein
MTKQVIDIGIQGNDGTGDSIRESFRKVNENFNELYAIFGSGEGTINFTDLSDTPDTYAANQVIMGSTDGSRLTARTLTSDGTIGYTLTDDGELKIKSLVGALNTDLTPTLIGPMDVNLQAIGRIPDPSQTLVDAFNLTYSNKPAITLADLAISKGYADRSYVRVSESGNLADPLKVRDEPLLPPTDNPDYDPSLTGNYIATEAVQRRDVVYRGGDTMTGPLYLDDHPGDMAGAGSPNGVDDYQAATKYYVDNSTFSSSVNLYVSTTGDDLQAKTPPGKEGRFWQYAYRSVGAAALAADNLISLASQEPGPYRQRISYTIGPDQYFSTINNVELVGGNKDTPGYQDAFDLLQANREFIQAEVIAYINNKYVNTFTYDKSTCQRDLGLILDAIGYDLVLDTTWNTTAAATSYMNSGAIEGKLNQTVESINFARDTILAFSYNDIAVTEYLNKILDSICYDLIFGSNYQSIQAGLYFPYAETDLSVSQMLAVIENLKLSILAIQEVSDVINAVDSIVTNLDTIKVIIQTGIIPVDVSMPDTASTPSGIASARFLLLNNIKFIQAEVIAYLTSEYPNLSYSKDTCRRDVQYMVWSIVYDMVYGGNSQSVYAGLRYWTGTTRNIAANELSATLASIDRINLLAQSIIVNESVATLYQQTVNQYENETYTGGIAGSTSISNNIAIIKSILEDADNAPTIVDVDDTAAPQILLDTRDAINLYRDDLTQGSLTYINASFPVINDPVAIAKINSLFKIVTDLMIGGIASRVDPEYTAPNNLATGVEYATILVNQNKDFIADQVVGWINTQYGTGDPLTFDFGGVPGGQETCKRDLKYIIEAIVYDLYYGGNQGSEFAGRRYWINSNNVIPAELEITIAAFGYASEVMEKVARNSTVTPLYTDTPQYINFDLANASAASALIIDAWRVVREVAENNPVLPSETITLTYPDLTIYDSVLKNTRTVILENKAEIQTQTTDWIDLTYAGGFNYNEATCYRDVGLIIDGMSIDIVTGGTYQAVTAGKSYYRNASARSVAIGTQFKETVDALEFAKRVGMQVLTQTAATRYQSLVTQVFNEALESAPGAVTVFESGMDTILNIIRNGFGAAPEPSFGTGIWNVRINNGGNGYVDQGAPGNNDIIPAKVIVGTNSAAYANIVKYVPNNIGNTDLIQVRLTKPGFFAIGEEIEFGETVKELQIVIFVEAGIYYEDYPIKLADNVSIKGDEFRRTIIRPRNRISQSPWRKVFFYRDAVIDAMELGPIDTGGTDYASESSLTIDGTTGKIVATLGVGQVPVSWIGKVLMDDVGPKRGKAVVDSVSGNFMNLSIIYPFNEVKTLAAGEWHLYDTINYGRHYLTNPLDVNSPAKNNRDIDVFLCNDAVRVNNLTIQGHGGFAMVLDPTGQIKTKSPYGQVCTSFSQSNNNKRFAGGQFVDGFAGRLRGTIVDIQDNGITVTVQGEVNSGLDIRPPQPPCAFFVQGFRYQVNDIVSFDASTATVVMTMDVATPYDAAGQYDNVKCSRDVGLILDAVGYDLVLGSNFQSVKAGLSYQRAYSSEVVSGQLTQTIAGMNKARELALAEVVGNPTAIEAINDRFDIINTIIQQGITAAPAITYPRQLSFDLDNEKAKDILVANKEFVKAEIVAWIADNYIIKDIPRYKSTTCARDVGYLVDAIAYDVMYGGNSQTKDSADAYYRGVTSYIAGEETVTAAAYGRLKTVLQKLVVNDNSTWTKSPGNSLTQNVSLPAAQAAQVTKVGTLSDLLIDFVQDGDYDTPVVVTYPSLAGENASLVDARLSIQSAKPTIQSNVITFLNTGGGLVINIEMGGNKSMLANDFAMINDLGYAIVCTNGAVSEQVSTFSYYCHTHYWANNGGQIRSVAGSNAHGNFGLRASGFDVTEKPDAVTLANNMVQTARVYKQGTVANEMIPTITKPALAIWILDYDYNPQNTTEVEIDHTLAGEGIIRYEINSVEYTTIVINGQPVLKMNISTAGNNGTSTTGLAAPLYDGQIITIRMLQNLKFLNIENVNPTRPSTALQFIDNLGDIYRIISYNLTEGTGELLPPNQSVLSTDTSFNYYKLATDIANVSTTDPDDPTKTQGVNVGDVKIAVLEITKQSVVDQLNKGIYVTGWAGRVHRIVSYTRPRTIATAIYAGASGTMLTVNTIAGLIEPGDVITGTGFISGQTVVSVTLGTPNSTIIISAPPDSTPSGTLTFGDEFNGYVTIDPNPIHNVGSDGTPVNALTFLSKTGTGLANRYVTFDIPFTPGAYPIIDSWYEVKGNSNTSYNGWRRISSVVSKTTVKVPLPQGTQGLQPGMLVKSLTPGVTLPDSVIIQEVVDEEYFTISPAVWIPSGTNISAILVAVISRIDITFAGTGYTTAPTITISGGGATSQAIATCTIDANGSIDVVTLVSPGFNYTDIPDITLSHGNAVLTAVLSSTATTNTTASAGVNTTTMTLVYPTDPGVFATGTDITITGFGSKGATTYGGVSGYAVVLNFSSTTAPATDEYFYVSGNTNPLYNGFYVCTASSTTSITLFYPNDPGTWSTSTTTTVRQEATYAESTSLGIGQAFSTTDAFTLRAGYPSGSPGQITVKISTCRATGHDFLDIGTGSYSTTNYPYQIYGNPAKSKVGSQEIEEEGVGRVFYVTTDQDGIFRVGRFFTVDQGTGTVTFSASIALSNLDGLGFKRGVVISEFSTDSSFANNGPDIVPVQSAVRGYIDKRLGLDHGGGPVKTADLVGPGYLPLSGALQMKGNFNMAGYIISNVRDLEPTSSLNDAANKRYVDQEVAKYDQFSELKDVTLNSASASQMLVYNGSTNKWNNATLGGDISISWNGTTLTSTIGSEKIVNSMVSPSAGIVQSKLSMQAASTSTSQPGAFDQSLLGLARFDGNQFTVTHGHAELRTSSSTTTGVTLGKIQQIATDTVLGNRSGSTASPSAITTNNVVIDGDGITNSKFFASGVSVTNYAMLVTTNGSSAKANTYGYIKLTTTREADSILKTQGAGEIDVAQLKVDSYKVIDVDTTNLYSEFYAPQGGKAFVLKGSSTSDVVSTVYGTIDVTNGTLKSASLTTGAAASGGNITGQWSVTSNSQIDFSSGTLKSRSLTTGAAGTTGTITGDWSLTSGSKLQSTYADLAEFYEGDREYEPGTVLIFGGEKEVTTTNLMNDTRSAGVVTTDPAYVMNQEQKGIKVCIALAGRVPVKVVGRVKKGDMLTTSATPGYAVKAMDPKLGSIIGKALEDKDYGEAGVIQVAIGRV